MKQLKKILMAMVLMLTMAFTLASCNNENNVDPATITTAEVFEKIEMTAINDDVEEKNVSYAEMSSATSCDSKKSGVLRFKCSASYKFEVSKIVVKAQSSYTEHKTGDKFLVYIYDNSAMGFSDPSIKNNTLTFQNDTDFNKQHTITITFTSGEFVVEKNGIVGIACSGGKHGYTSFTNIEIFGKVITE